MPVNYYKILGIQHTATSVQIKKAFREKAKLYHPDKNSSPKAHETFALINEAYDVLMDANKRFLHDLKMKYITDKKMVHKKYQYYGNSKSKAAENFHYDFTGFGRMKYETRFHRTILAKPWVFNLFFAIGMCIGFIIVFVTAIGTVMHLWPPLFVLLVIPGFILIRDGWNGITGKRKSRIEILLKKIIQKFPA